MVINKKRYNLIIAGFFLAVINYQLFSLDEVVASSEELNDQLSQKESELDAYRKNADELSKKLYQMASIKNIFDDKDSENVLLSMEQKLFIFLNLISPLDVEVLRIQKTYLCNDSSSYSFEDFNKDILENPKKIFEEKYSQYRSVWSEYSENQQKRLQKLGMQKMNLIA